MSPRRAIYLTETGQLEVITQTEPYSPAGSQSLVRVALSAINPADLKHYYMGMNSFVAGYEWIGTVESVGPESPFRVGEVLFGLAKPGHRRPITAGAHQDLLLAETFMTYRLPADPGLDWKQVVSWPTGLLTVSDALFNCLGFAFPPLGSAGVEGQDPKGRAILIWGGASLLGIFAIQLAKFVGFGPIFTTASAKNHETLLRLGATQCFDYKSPSVVGDIRGAAAASGKDLSVVFDAVTTGTGFAEPESAKAKVDLSKSSPELARRCLTEGATDIRLCSSLPVEHDEQWRLCLAVREPDQQLDLIRNAQRADETREYSRRLEAVVGWAVANYKVVGFRVPNIRVIKGAEEGIKTIRDASEGRISMEKVVIEHPM